MNYLEKKNLKNVLFFSRDYQSHLFPKLNLVGYNCFHVTLTRHEKRNVEKMGQVVVGCLEDEFSSLDEAELSYPYLKFSWGNDRYLKDFTFSQRTSIQKKVVTFWRRIFEKISPIAVINEPIAIEVSEILYIECQRLSIKYIALSSFLAQDTLFFQQTPMNSSFGKNLNDIVPDPNSLTLAENLSQMIHDGIFNPSYIKNLKPRMSASRVLDLIKPLLLEIYKRFRVKNKIILQLCYGDNTSLHAKSLLLLIKYILYSKRYNDLNNLPPDVDFYFYPMHYEPEASILYCAYLYDNQESLIENILKCIPENEFLVVKEHPNQPGVLLQSQFKNIKSKWPNLILLRSEIPASNIIKSCKALITLGGTAGFEALTIGKSVINFGNIYYDSYNEIININSFDKLKELMRNGINKVDANEGRLSFIYYMAKIFTQMKKGNPFPHINLYEKENLNALSNSICTELDHISHHI
jgi:hypothetical protein